MRLSLSKDAKRMLVLIAGQALVILVVSAVYFRKGGFSAFAYGVLLACAVNFARVYLLERTVQKALEMQSGGLGFGWGQYMLRFVLTGAVLVLAALSPHINVWGAIIGVLTFQTAVYMLRFFIARDNAKLEKGA